MIDIRILREDPEKIRNNLEKRNITNYPLQDLLDLDRKRRDLISRNQKLKEERNRISVEISRAKSAGRDAQDSISRMKLTSDEISGNDKEIETINSKLNALLAALPNFVDPSVPVGKDENANLEVGRWGETKSGTLDHIDIANEFDLIDVERAAKTSGARFYFLRRDLVRLNYALISAALDYLRIRGFILIQPPYMLKRDAIGGAVILGDFEEVIYKIQDEDLYLSELPSMRLQLCTWMISSTGRAYRCAMLESVLVLEKRREHTDVTQRGYFGSINLRRLSSSFTANLRNRRTNTNCF